MFKRYYEIQQRRALGEIEEGGFTLIELLIVIVVLGILAAVVVFALGGVTGQSAIAACSSDAKTVDVAVAVYQSNNSGNPSQAQLLGTAQSQNGTTTSYLKSWPSNPSYYSIGLSGSTVQVTLTGTDPGAIAGTGDPGTTPAAENFDGWTYPTGATSTTGTSLAGLGICAGA